MVGYQRLCEITNTSKKEMKTLINFFGLPSMGLVTIKPIRKYNKTYYHFMYELENESKIIELLGLEVKENKFLKEGFY